MRKFQQFLRRQADPLFYGGVALTAVLYFCLVWPGLGGPVLWNDEANTAMLADNIRQHGVPLADYGQHVVDKEIYSKNFLGVEAGHGWLSFYLCALSFAIGGETEFAARAPFAVCGALAVLAVAFVGRLLYGRFLGWLAGLLLALNPIFLQYCRQSRYYALVLLLTPVTLGAYLLVRDTRLRWFALPLAAFFLFHASEYFCAIVLAGLFLADAARLAWARAGGPPVLDRLPWKRIILGCAALILPWVVFFSIGRSLTEHVAFNLSDLWRHVRLGFRSVWEFFPYLIVLGALPMAPRRASYFPVAAAAITLALIILIPDAIFTPGGGLNGRYLMHLLPLGALIAARGLGLLRWKWTWLAAPAIVLLGLIPGASGAGDMWQKFERAQHFYRHLPHPDPERLALASAAEAIGRNQRVFVSGSYEYEFIYYVLGRDRIASPWKARCAPGMPQTSVVIVNQENYDEGITMHDCPFVIQCRETIYRDRTVLGANWAEGPKVFPARPYMGIWECPPRGVGQ
jgi:hypothetical protein